MIRRRVAARAPGAPLTSRAESSVESAPSGAVKAPMAYVVAATVPIVLLELLIDDRTVRLIPLLILLPAFPAAVGTVRQTVYAVGWVLIVIPAVLLYRPLPSSYNFAIVMVLAFVLGVLCVVTCHWRIRREGELLRVRSTAVALQRQMLRSLPILTDRVIVDGVYLPVEADRLVGGDVYEVGASPYGTRLLFGDVQGKGLPAIGAAFAMLGAFREAALREPTLTALVNDLEEAVVRHNAFAQQTGEPERFVTALVLGIDISTETQAVNCGHPPPYLLTSGPVVHVQLGDPGVPLGLADLSPEPRTVAWFPFPPGATLVICSDGVTEARSATGAFYPLAERMGAWADISPWAVADHLTQDLSRHTAGEQRDDISALVVRRTN
ncbi:PP2C family protein-serine/threonine phosphatase [Streptomyces europaeiscabiei]|uniref:PP2C family protein-serine/threonine phosphatase n=1 Tax=Streptomyces europaeiscabiei TaxID=146819 RepID=UPI0029A237CD|nr:PP2C family protein-serine/threonine phosphatase [Streptomyces europaeiscabiei]MDX3611268.1 PP2C family protein-serine/threonine phosphatase [Streptomyces europaeiscabiei]